MSDPKKIVQAALVIIGDEILSGRTEDANLNYLANWLNEVGIRLAEVRVVADTDAAIIQAVNDCRAAYDYVFTTGGIGPTHDDITAGAIAKAFDVALIEHPEARAIMETYYQGDDLTPARLKMAQTPDGASLVNNPVSGAPGFQIENVFVLAGIPMIMQAMLEKLGDRLEGAAPVVSGALTVFRGESSIAAELSALQAEHADVSVGSYPFFRSGKIGTCLVFRSGDGAAVETAMSGARAFLDPMGVKFEEGEPNF